MTQNERILAHLKCGYSLTPLDALKMFGCFRLGSRINDLRKEGHYIKTTIINFGSKHVASYKLVSKKDIESLF